MSGEEGTLGRHTRAALRSTKAGKPSHVRGEGEHSGSDALARDGGSKHRPRKGGQQQKGAPSPNFRPVPHAEKPCRAFLLACDMSRSATVLVSPSSASRPLSSSSSAFLTSSRKEVESTTVTRVSTENTPPSPPSLSASAAPGAQAGWPKGRKASRLVGIGERKIARKTQMYRISARLVLLLAAGPHDSMVPLLVLRLRIHWKSPGVPAGGRLNLRSAGGLLLNDTDHPEARLENCVLIGEALDAPHSAPSQPILGEREDECWRKARKHSSGKGTRTE